MSNNRFLHIVDYKLRFPGSVHCRNRENAILHGVNLLLSKYSTLNELKPGQSARVRRILCSGNLRRRFLDLGLGSHAPVSCVGRSPAGDPAAFLIRGTVIALRDRDSRQIVVEQTEPGRSFRSVALAGNPNVGKSTVFNGLTGLHQHTGNWPGKTIEQASGTFETVLHRYRLTDTPGAYSLSPRSPEEEITRDFLCFGGAEAVIAVCDACCLERNLNLVLQILELCPRTVVCINMMDEAAKRSIHINLKTLSADLGVPVVGITARDKTTLSRLTEALDKLLDGPGMRPASPVPYPAPLEAAIQILENPIHKLTDSLLPARWLALRLLEEDRSLEAGLEKHLGFHLKNNFSVQSALGEANSVLYAAGLKSHAESDENETLSDAVAESILNRAGEIAHKAVQTDSLAVQKKERFLDRILTGRFSAYPVMLFLLAFILWLTIAGANYPSELLSRILFSFQDILSSVLVQLRTPAWLCSMLTDGAYRVLAWVVSVMLPPMAIFFPLFTFLEDTGYLPRIAYNLDHAFQRCRSCGKQALTLCMSFGCNAVGVTGCRIIESPRERMIAILTAGFIPCNGRFPALITLIFLFLTFLSGTVCNNMGKNPAAAFLFPALLLTAVMILAAGTALLISRLLSVTLLRGLPSAFTLELPPYRRPQPGKIIIRSLLDRTFFVLGRAVTAAVPAGVLIWLLANIYVNDTSLLSLCAGVMDPLATPFGLDGVILMAFILGLPANEIVVPIMLSAYLQQGILLETNSFPDLASILMSNGWTAVTAICTLIFMLFHWPCAATLLTIRRETGSWKWSFLAAALPTGTGLILCFLIAQSMRILTG